MLKQAVGNGFRLAGQESHVCLRCQRECARRGKQHARSFRTLSPAFSKGPAPSGFREVLEKLKNAVAREQRNQDKQALQQTAQQAQDPAKIDAARRDVKKKETGRGEALEKNTSTILTEPNPRRSTTGRRKPKWKVRRVLNDGVGQDNSTETRHGPHPRLLATDRTRVRIHKQQTKMKIRLIRFQPRAKEEMNGSDEIVPEAATDKAAKSKHQAKPGEPARQSSKRRSVRTETALRKRRNIKIGLAGEGVGAAAGTESPSLSGQAAAAPRRSAQRTAVRQADGSVPAGNLSSTPPPGEEEAFNKEEILSLRPGAQPLQALNIPNPPVPRLAYGLDRVLFTQGVTELRDSHSRVYNFDPSLEKLAPLDEFDFNLLEGFTSPSRDSDLARVAADYKKKYIGSTSSMTDSVAAGLKNVTFSGITKAPSAAFLRYKDGRYALDTDKEFDDSNVLSIMGRVMEKLFTTEKTVYERHLIGSSDPISKDEAATPSSYHYSTVGDFVVRSQLDAYDPRMPGTGIFDLKTRAVLPIRMDSENFTWGMDYELRYRQGVFQSYEREYWDMFRATMLKYSLQVRLGRMDGIFVAYHNIARVFGFQYISLPEMDHVLHGQNERELGDQELVASLQMLNQLFDRATEVFPKQSLRVHTEARPGNKEGCFMYVFFEPYSEEEVEAIQQKTAEKIRQWESEVTDVERTIERKPGEDVTVRMQKFRERLRGMSGMPPVASPQDDREDAERSIVEVTGGVSISDAMGDKPSVEVMFSDAADGLTATEMAQVAGPEGGKPNDVVAAADLKEEDPTRPALGFIVRARSRVNGRYTRRPSHLRKDDQWEIEYIMQDTSGQSKGTRRLLDALKMRRLKADSDHDGVFVEEYFGKVLQREAAEGRRWRTAQDEKDHAQSQGRVKMWDDAV